MERDAEIVFQPVAFSSSTVEVFPIVAGHEVRRLVCACLVGKFRVCRESFEVFIVGWALLD